MRRFVAVSVVGSVLCVGCAGGDDDANGGSVADLPTTSRAAATTEAAITAIEPSRTNAENTGTTTGITGFPRIAALQECLVAQSAGIHSPTQPSSRVPVVSLPADVAADAWDACRSAHFAALHESIAGFDPTDLPSEAEALAFADCMATLGWITPLGPIGPVVQDLSSYMEANAACRTPVAGESVAASYCRFVQAIYDRAAHDSSMSVTGVPYAPTQEARRQAAIALYDEALQIAPDDLVPALRALQDGFRQGTRIPEAVWDTVIDYHLSVCGVWVYLGSLD